MKTYVHARLDEGVRAVLDGLKRSTGRSESDLVRRGLQLLAKEMGRPRSALDAAGRSVGRFKKGPSDLSTGREHLDGFGE